MGSAKPRLLVATKAFRPVIGGVEEAARRLAVAATGKFDVTVLAVSETQRASMEDRDGITIVKVPKLAKVFSSPFSFGFHPTFVRLARQSDLVHVHSPWPPGEMSLVLTPTSAKIVVTYHFDVVRQKIVSPFYKPLVSAALRRSDRIVCSNPNLQATSPYLSPYVDKTEVIPYGVDYRDYSLQPGEQGLVDQIRRGHRRPIVLFVGRLVYYKGAEYLIRAASRVDVDVLLVGSGPLELKLRELAQSLKVNDRVSFLGAVSDPELRIQYHACDVFVLPSVARSEAFGLVLLEAMCASKPLVTTELGTGTSWVNQHGQTGLVVPPRDEGALASAIGEIAFQPDRARAFGAASRKRVLEVFSQERYAANYMRLFEGLLR